MNIPVPDFLKPVIVAFVISAGGWAVHLYQDTAVYKTEIGQVKKDLTEETEALKAHELVHAQDSKVLYELNGQVKAVSQQIDSLREDLRSYRQLPK